MTAKIKCSNCGAEISNLNFSWGKKYLWFVIPIMLLGFLPMLRLTLFKGDATKDLALSGIEKRQNEDSLSIVGLVTNTGKRSWSSVRLEAEFYDASGNFIDEGSDYLRADIPSGGKEHFKITIKVHPEAVKAPETKMIVKVVGGHTMPF